MSNMTPFEIRLELLKMAKDMLEQEYHGKREKLANEWHVQVDVARHAVALLQHTLNYQRFQQKPKSSKKPQS